MDSVTGFRSEDTRTPHAGRGRPGAVPWRSASGRSAPSPAFSPAAAIPVERFPHRLDPPAFHEAAYPAMYLSRRLEERVLELFRKGYVKGTVTISIGNEATTIGASMPLRPGRDVSGLLHRDFGAHLMLGATPYELVCQYMANADSPTRGREGNVHHGKAAERRYPMMSHLGRMLGVVVGATWEARRQGEDIFGLAPIGDGGSSTGEFHEAINLASVHRVPVLFLIENNGYSFSTPVEFQYRCERLSDRAIGYGAPGRTIDGTDAWTVYDAVHAMLERMRDEPGPALLECRSLRLHGHAAYDKGDYVPKQTRAEWEARDPLPAARRKLLDVAGYSEQAADQLERSVEEVIDAAIDEARRAARPSPVSARSSTTTNGGVTRRIDGPAGATASVYAPASDVRLPAFSAPKAKNGDAVRLALEYLLTHRPRAFLIGQDVGPYGSAFKTCKGLFERFGLERVLDMPICESAMVGMALGASQVGGEPIVEFQFADFATEAATQIGLNAGTWYFRAEQPAPVLMRLPCGGGLTMGMFHSGEYEGVWSCFPGLKVLYPVTPQETFEALVAGLVDPNPCLVLEHKLLYWGRAGAIDFDGRTTGCWQPRRHASGEELTIVAFGAMVSEAVEAAREAGHRADVWNPWVLKPLELAPIVRSIQRTGRLLVVHEASAGMGLGERLIGRLCCQAGGYLKAPPALVAAPDTPVPFAPELESAFRPDRAQIVRAIGQLCGAGRSTRPGHGSTRPADGLTQPGDGPKRAPS